MGYWKHKKRAKNDNTPEPTESAFFSNESVGSITNALIREGNQNILDEVKENLKKLGYPARVKITHSGRKYAISPADAKNLLKELTPHLEAEKNGIIKSELPDFNTPMQYLLFEDFNTNGLEGDPLECLYESVNDITIPHNFYYFWRAYGRSGKLANKMGSWGVGKAVFPAVSKINCFWALTIRDSDNEAYLIGQSVLKTHNRADKPAAYGYFPWGFYGLFDEEDFPIPESAGLELNKFQKLFRLKRNIADRKEDRDGDTGVSIIVPYPKDEVSAETLVFSTIKQFFYPILKGRLDVEIQYEDRIIRLKKDTLKPEIDKLDFSKISDKEKSSKEQLLSLFDFTEWILTLNANDHIKLHFNSPNRAFEWRQKEMFKNIDLASLQRRFDNGEPLSFVIPVKYQPEGSEPEFREFNAYIKKDLDLQEPESTFIRDFLTITGVKSLKRKGTRGIVLISQKDLVTFFGQAEGPAHTGWHKDNFRVRYESIEEIISFVQRSLERLYTFLQFPAEGFDTKLLSELFFIDLPESAEGGDRSKEKGEKKDEKPKFDLPAANPKRYLVTQLEHENGFKITNNPDSEELSEIVNVKLAYMRPDTAKPFNKYSRFDFDVSKMTVSRSNINVEVLEGNQIQFTPTDANFELKVTGFDPNRDLVIGVN